MPSLLAIDVSTKRLSCALRLYGFQPPLCFEVPSVPGCMRTLAMVMSHMKLDVVAVEGCYLSRNAKTYAKLFHVKESILEAFRSNCSRARAIEVAPTQWRVALLHKPPEKVTGIKRDEWHRRATARAADVLGYDPPSQDFADAVCLLLVIYNGMLEEEL